MILGAAVVPTAPLLVPGVSRRLPRGAVVIAAATTTVLRGLPPHDLAVLVASGPAGLHVSAVADLAGIGRPDLCKEVAVDRASAEALAVADRPLVDDALPLGLAVLALLYAGVGPAAPVVPMSVAPEDEPAELGALGKAVVAVAGGRRAVVVTAGDLSAGLTEQSPLALVDGARAWDDEVVDVVAGGRMDRLARMGPAAAARVGALGWAPLVVLAGVAAAARLGSVVRCYGAPRGVGYLVATAG